MNKTKKGTPQERLAQRLSEIKAGGILRREASLGAIDVEARTAELSFSSEIEYRRYWGIEILGHEPGEVDLSRINNDAALLWMHDWNDQRGVVVAGSVHINDGKGRCIVRFSKSEKGEQLFQDVQDKIVTKVSVGYHIDALKLVEEREDVDVYRVTSWQPYEISLVSVPADDTVGIGRSAVKPQEESTNATGDTSHAGESNSDRNNSTKGNRTMNIKTLRDGAGNLVRAEVDENGSIVKVLEVLERAGDDVRQAEQRGLQAERDRIAAINALADQYGQRDLAMQMITQGKSAADFQRELLHKFAEQRSQKPLGEQVKDANIGMSQKEIRNFSIFRAVRALMDPTNENFRKAAAFEFEASRAAAEAYGKTPKGIIIPNDVLADRAFMVSGGAPNGSTLVGTTHMAGSYIEMLVKRSWVMKRARVLAGLVGNVDIPRKNARSTAYWVGEGGSPTESKMGTDQILFSPKTVGAYTDVTRKLLMQSSPDAEALVRDDLLETVSLEIDRVAIYGTGTTNQPKGLKNYTGINGVDLATDKKPTFAEVVAMETAIAVANADVGAMSYAFGAGMRGHFKTTPKMGAGTEATIWEAGNTINGYATDVTNQIDPADIFFGNWMDLVVAMWGGLELTTDPYALSTSGGVRLVALQDVDVNLRHVESFAWGNAAVIP